jgi:hypothetical protein
MNESNKRRGRCIFYGLTYSIACLMFWLLALGSGDRGFVYGARGATMDTSTCYVAAAVMLVGATYCFVQAFRTKSN